MFECLRKIAIAGLPAFFDPSGSASQLIFGLVVCFTTFGMYVHLKPFVNDDDDLLASLCQVQIFFALVSAVALIFDKADTVAAANLDVLLVILWLVPMTLGAFLTSPVAKMVLVKLTSRKKQPTKSQARPDQTKQSVTMSQTSTAKGETSTQSQGSDERNTVTVSLGRPSVAQEFTGDEKKKPSLEA